MKLFYFRATPTIHGVMPAFYAEVPPEDERDARELGGRDVSHLAGAWDAFDVQRREEDEGYL